MSKSISSNKPSSMIWRKISSSIVSVSDDRLSSDRKLDWCSIRLLRSASSCVRGVRCVRTESSSRRRRDRPSSACLSALLLRSRGLSGAAARRASRLACARFSRRLNSRACSNIRWSSSSSPLSSSCCGGGNTESPGLYRWAISSFSAGDRALSGCASRTISSSVVTVAFGRVPRTSARHDGQVNRGEVPEDRCRDPCAENHSFKHNPQKVCRQSRRVRGW